MFSFLTYAVLENCIIVSFWKAFEAINLHVFLSKSLSTRSSEEEERSLWKRIVSLTQADDPDILFGTTKLLRRIYYHCGGE